MAALNIYREQMCGCTIISNTFIDYYMADANEAQLQVYLYLLRMVSANLPVSVADIADKLDHSEKEVLRALKYWELQKLLSLDYDNKKKLTGIHFLPMPVQVTPEAEMTFAGESSYTEAVTQEVEITEPRSLTPQAFVSDPTGNPVMEEPVQPSIYIKPTYTAEQLREFKAQDGAAQLLYVAQAYVGKPLTPNDIKTIYFMWDVLHFSDDLIDYLIQYCVDRGKRDFRYMEKVAINWAEEGITTPEQAQNASTKYDKSVYTIMNALGKSNSPTAKEAEFIRRWMNEYGFTTEVIVEACNRTVLATDKHRFEYAEGILSNWKKNKVYSIADIERVDGQFQKQKSTSTSKNNNNQFNSFIHSQYDVSELEKKLLSN